MNIYIQEVDLTEWMTKENTTLIQKDHLGRLTPQQLQTYNMPTEYVENTNVTNEYGYLLQVNKRQIFP